MRCKCGFLFSGQMMLQEPRPFESYAVIKDVEYQEFLKAEMKAARSDKPDARLRKLARSATFVGSLLKCPKCARLLLLTPGEANLEYYQREEEART